MGRLEEIAEVAAAAQPQYQGWTDYFTQNPTRMGGGDIWTNLGQMQRMTQPPIVGENVPDPTAANPNPTPTPTSAAGAAPSPAPEGSRVYWQPGVGPETSTQNAAIGGVAAQLGGAGGGGSLPAQIAGPSWQDLINMGIDRLTSQGRQIPQQEEQQPQQPTPWGGGQANFRSPVWR